MAMTYANFRDYLLRFLWRENDAVLSSDLTHLIKMAEARLNRDMRVELREQTATTPATDESVALPPDYHSMRVVELGTHGPLGFLTPFNLRDLRTKNGSTSVTPNYSVEAGSIKLIGPMSAADPQTVTMLYYRDIPDFEALDASWLTDSFLDLYTYAVLRHTGTYLQNDARVAVWKNEYDETLASVNDDAIRRRLTDGPLEMPIAGVVA